MRLGDEVEMSVQHFADQADEHIVYHWPTSFTAVELLKECTPFSNSGTFVAPVEVVVYVDDNSQQSSHKVCSYDDYIAGAAVEDPPPVAVRFNASSQLLGEFSVIWTRSDRSSSVVQGHAQAIFEKTPEMMGHMMEQSVISRGKPFVRRMLDEGRRMQLNALVKEQ